MTFYVATIVSVFFGITSSILIDLNNTCFASDLIYG